MPRSRFVVLLAGLTVLAAAGAGTTAWLLPRSVVSAIPGLGPSWTDEASTNTLHSGQGPDFPDTLAGWQLADQWADQTRVFGEWTSLCAGDDCAHSYPATMNGCANQRFLLRWRSNGGEKLTFAHGTMAGDIGTLAEEQLTEPVSIGWAELHGCGWPLWKHSDPNGVTDVTVSVQQWTPTA
ncbi:hypothetical protein AB0F81_36695 [Actinoplanes sp. NPDC024001]|uniref:hypothetical protein n=1 Tax=Actinoplanes sp. NPDC024001 TaxID=3154598 RepID=UPI00340B3AB5